jgi:hypothetical protein
MKKRGRPPGSRNKPKDGTNPVSFIEEDEQDESPTRRKLPDNDSELDAVLKRYKILARPIVTGISGTLEVLNTAPLDKDEQDGGHFAIAAMLYEFGAEMDSRVLFGLWLAGIAAPRLAQAAVEMKKQRQLEKAGIRKPVIVDMPKVEHP